jgi:hypothetical protein
VLSSLLKVTPTGIGEYDVYAFPGAGGKLSLEKLLEADPPAKDDLTAESLVSRIAGLGPVFAAELALRQRKSGRSFAEEIRTMLDQVRAPSRAAYLYTELPLGHILDQNEVKRLHKAILSPIELETLARTHLAPVLQYSRSIEVLLRRIGEPNAPRTGEVAGPSRHAPCFKAICGP